jgi:hypothetical protein
MSDQNFSAYNWNQNRPAANQGGQDNFIYDGSGASRNGQGQGGQDNFIYDGSGAANNNGAWAGEHPFQRPTDRTRMQPACTEVSPDGRTVNVFYINNAYFNGSNVNGGYDFRQNPQYNYTRYDQNYQALQQQQQMNYYRNPIQQFEMQREQQQWRREQQIIAYQNYIRQQEMQQNWGGANYAGAGYNNYNNPYAYQQYGGGGVGINLSFLFGGHHRGR